MYLGLWYNVRDWKNKHNQLLNFEVKFSWHFYCSLRLGLILFQEQNYGAICEVKVVLSPQQLKCNIGEDVVQDLSFINE